MAAPPEFLPGSPLGNLDDMREGTLYHQLTPSGVAITVQREGSLFKWRTLRYADEDGYGEGSREQRGAWLRKR